MCLEKALPCCVLQHLLPPGPEPWCVEREEGFPSTSASAAPTQTPLRGNGRDSKISMVRLDSGTRASQPPEDSLRKIPAQSLI